MIFCFNTFWKSMIRQALPSCFALTLLLPIIASAADTPCDPDYYESLESRAWMEAQRETEQNQNLIFKPDSVLEYTCFNKFGDVLAKNATIFSESTTWGTVNPSGSMEEALTHLVGSAMYSYLQSNFDHKYLGDRGKDNYRTTSKFDGTISAGSYTCSEMAKVWQKESNTAKCYNFIPSGEDKDGFFTFEDYAKMSDSVRRYPEACEVNDNWATENEKALGRYVGGDDEKLPWNPDTEFEYFDVTAACSESPTVKTGLSLPDGSDEIVCLIPGCHYDGSSCTE